MGLNYFNVNDLKSEAENQIFSDFENRVNQVSMFEEKKLHVFLNIFSAKIFKEKFLEEISEYEKSKDVFLVYQDEKVDERDGLFKFFKKNAKCQEFKLLEDLPLKNWIKKEFEKRNANIEQKALDKFFDFIANDLWRAENEIKKLSAFKKGKTIKSEDIDLMVKPKIETDIFKTIEAISRREKRTALNLLQKHIENGDSPLYLLSMINFQFRNILIVKDMAEKGVQYYLIAQQSGLHPYIVKKSWEISKNFSLLEFKKIYKKIFQVDCDIKTGKIESEMALNMFVAEV